ncbi:two-component system, OmpR family, sensor histidine kinase VicK [Jeotgalicoccus aerolatus]|uniref:Sensor protein kinase WalK n=1 Tax=Jeotgalicoccus aerolatus TaxID=709510 RepID=A0A1G9A838_9STAP|nr:cell wall metabolism sensor histidine kinase WalK [Jeotgalicoccus aerolatus]SDK23516.1 two-component system, OmpR family, sensor histidine kinase VicK [Jeotgalicoccus aerolatus]HJG33535.1 cell wall metabolism sensor histidine kinase WalK [Jeotgalicoccus aerolatus]
MKQFLKNLQSLQFKLVMIYMLLIIIGMQIIGLYFTNSLERDLTGNFKNNIDSQVTLIDTRIKEIFQESGDDREQMHSDIQSLLADYGNRPEIEEIRYINADNILVGTSRISNESLVGSRINEPMTRDALQSGIANDEIFVNVDKDNQRVWILNQPVVVSDEVAGVIYVESNVESIYAQLEAINNTFIIATLFSLVITSILGIFVARTITKPITDMRNQALLMSEGDYTSRVQIYSDDEIGQLAGSFNILSKKVQEAQANTESEKKRLDSVITHMSDGIIATDRRGRIRIVNEMAVGMLNLRTQSDDLHGKNMLDLLRLGEELNLEDIIQEANDSHLIFIDSGDDVTTLRVNFSTIVTDTGFINGYIAVLHDVTEQERIDAERREFVANVSHELRTPLTSMRSYIEALQDGAWQDEEIAPKFLSVTRDETDRMGRLVEDLLQLSRMDNDAEEIQKEVVDFKLFINRVIDRFEMTHKDEVVFTRHIPDAPLFTDISVDKMGQVLDNVLSNAIKYQHGDPKRVDIHLKQNTLYNRMTIRIKDYGLGIPNNKVDRIFDRFYRVDKGRARKMGGTGLGLAISKEIIEAHNGKIWANSVENEGTTVFINLPCEVIEEDEWDV